MHEQNVSPDFPQICTLVRSPANTTYNVNHGSLQNIYTNTSF